MNEASYNMRSTRRNCLAFSLRQFFTMKRFVFIVIMYIVLSLSYAGRIHIFSPIIETLKGVPYFQEESMDLAVLLSWLLASALIVYYVGAQTENLLDMQKYIIPRLGSLKMFGFTVLLGSMIIALLFYLVTYMLTIATGFVINGFSVYSAYGRLLISKGVLADSSFQSFKESVCIILANALGAIAIVCIQVATHLLTGKAEISYVSAAAAEVIPLFLPRILSAYFPGSLMMLVRYRSRCGQGIITSPHAICVNFAWIMLSVVAVLLYTHFSRTKEFRRA